MKTDKYSVGVIGAGVMGERMMNALCSHERFFVTAVADVSPDRAKEAARHAGGASWHTDHRELLAREGLDLVYLAVPPKFHHPIALDVLASGRHLLCEKPLANTTKEAEEMLRAARAAGVIHAMHFPLYYRPVYAELKRRLEALGTIRRIDIVTHFHQWPRPWQQTAWLSGREQGGFIREVLPHFLHLTQSLFGRLRVVRSDVEYPADPLACEVGVSALLQVEDGTPVTINGLSGIARQEHLSYTVYGTEGTLSVVNWGTLLAGGRGEPLAEVPLPDENRLHQLLDELAAALDGREARLIGFETGVEVQNVLDALLDLS